MSIKDWIVKSPLLFTSAEFRRQQKSRRTFPIFEWAHPHVTMFGFSDDNSTILTYAKDRAATTYFRETGTLEKDHLLRCIALIENEDLRMGGYFMDVGANMGSHSIWALRSGAFSRTLSIEPAPDNFRLLRANVLLNDLESQVHGINAAAGAEDGILNLYVSSDNFGDHRLASGDAQANELHGELHRDNIPVRVAKLDTLLTEAGLDPEQISLVWIDAQGFEGFILQGAEGILKSKVPIHMEIWPHGLKQAGSAEILLTLLERHFTRFYDTAKGTAAAVLPISEFRPMYNYLDKTDGQTDILALP